MPISIATTEAVSKSVAATDTGTPLKFITLLLHWNSITMSEWDLITEVIDGFLGEQRLAHIRQIETRRDR